MSQKNDMSRVRKSIEKSIELADEERRRKLMVRRLEFARAGIAAYHRRQLTEAVKSFQGYIRTLEELHDVKEGGLTPACFDIKKDRSELLMISGIYWDLTKLFDRTRSAARRHDFKHYLEKYVLFSKGMPFQALCAETLRKYIHSEKQVHRSDFNRAYQELCVTRCFVATALIDVTQPQTLSSLYWLRDHVLRKSTCGRKMIASYYKIGPSLALLMYEMPLPLRQLAGRFLDLIAAMISMNQRSHSLGPEDKLAIRKINPKR